MRKHFCAICLLHSVIYWKASPGDVVTLILFKFLYCSFYDKKKKKKKKTTTTVNVLKIWTQCFLFLQNASKCSCSPKTYIVEVVHEHLYISKLPTSCIPSVPVVIPEVTETGSHRCWGVWYMSHLMTKPTKWASAQSDQSLCCAFSG